MQERLFDRRGIAMWSPNGGGDGNEETIYEPYVGAYSWPGDDWSTILCGEKAF